MLAVAIVARLHELNHATVQTATSRAHHQTQRTSGFPFTVSGMDHQQTFCLFLVVRSPPLVFLFFSRHTKSISHISSNIFTFVGIQHTCNSTKAERGAQRLVAWNRHYLIIIKAYVCGIPRDQVAALPVPLLSIRKIANDK